MIISGVGTGARFGEVVVIVYGVAGVAAASTGFAASEGASRAYYFFLSEASMH